MQYSRNYKVNIAANLEKSEILSATSCYIFIESFVSHLKEVQPGDLHFSMIQL